MPERRCHRSVTGQAPPAATRAFRAGVVWVVACRSHRHRIADPTRTDRSHLRKGAGRGRVGRSDATPDIRGDGLTSGSRLKVDDRRALQAVSRLTDRDRYICRLLYDHQVLTTHQVRQVRFDSQRRTTLRLSQLHQLRILDRFRPLRLSGSAPNHWILDTLGAAVVAAERGVDLAELGWRKDRLVALAASSQLGHLVGTNGIFCSLLETARQRPDAELVLWWPARRCARRWGQIVRPDGYGVWREGDRRVAFLLEYDNGTERIARLGEKLQRYRRLFDLAGERVWVLFCFPGPHREANARRALNQAGLPVATTHLQAGPDLSDRAWLPTSLNGSHEPRRVRLIDLPLRGRNCSRDTFCSSPSL